MTRTLFDELPLGRRAARNRLVRASTTSNLAEANSVSDRLVAHYRRLAQGGVGTIVSEALRIHHSILHGPSGIAGFDPGRVDGLARWADAVHEAGALFIGQLNHSGRQHLSTSIPPRLVGPSPVACPRSGGVPHPLTGTEIGELADGYVASARNLQRAGFDGVELNGAQGHLLQQFLSPFSNLRTDRYGGDPERRATFAREILTRIRDAAPADFVVGYRLGVDEFTQGGLTIELAARFAVSLQDAGLVDYISLSQGNFNSIAAHLPDRHEPHIPFREVQAQVGRVVDRVAAIACTGVVDPADAERLVAEGWADGVAMSRALTVDPDWPVKARTGRVAAIRPCIQCNSCWSGLHEGRSTLTCVQNAEVGRELEMTRLPEPTARRRVVVAGGGPAGLELARVAASRGHQVTLFERSGALGGKAAPGRGDIGAHPGYARAATWLDRAVRDAGVDLRLGAPATAEGILAERPDVVVVATGATPMVPEVVTDGSVRACADVAELDDDLSRRRVLVFDEDGHYWAAQVAEEAARRGAGVVLATRFFEPFRELPIVSRIAALRCLDEAAAEVLPLHELVRFEGGSAVLRHYESHRERRIPDVDAALWVGVQRPEDDLAAALEDSGVRTHLIGDARAPRRLRDAIREGFDLAQRL